MNIQKTEYAENGERICFGLSEHALTEMLPKLSDKAEADLKLLSSWIRKKQDYLVRPVHKSDWSLNKDYNRACLRVTLGLLFIRELPIKSFPVRCVITYLYLTYFIYRGVGQGFFNTNPVAVFAKPWLFKMLQNRPDLYRMTATRELPKIPFTHSDYREWRNRQQPVYHQYHKTVYRYRFRKPRYIQWDGTQNQPIMPFHIDDSTGVINGTFRRNPNTNPNLK